MNKERFSIASTPGRLILAIFLVLAISLACRGQVIQNVPNPGFETNPTAAPAQVATQKVVPTLPAATPQSGPTLEPLPQAGSQDRPGDLSAMYEQLHPGVVNIQVILSQAGQTGQALGSGFILDDQGHIVTNNHVVEGADNVTVVFYDGLEAPATVVGTDDDSDLAVIKVDQLPDGVHSLPLGDSNQVKVGEWVIAIGNPFGLGGSMSIGIVSAVGRTIESGVTPFSIPQAIQTDAAINPGNSGGPLINMAGQVVGVNAQIATGGQTGTNSGVGFAIPSNVVRLVAPVLISQGAYEWPWLGVTGGSLNLAIMQANNLNTQQGAYLDGIEPGGPADKAGLKGSTGEKNVNGFPVPVGGDVVVAADGKPIRNFDDLLVSTAAKKPGNQMVLTILRNGQQQDVTVTLEPRPQNFNPQQQQQQQQQPFP